MPHLLQTNYKILACCAILLSSCAQIVPPQGGERDSTPPQLISTNLVDSGLHFSLSDLEFRFDEVIQSSGKVVDISPLIEGDFDAKAVHKTLKIKVPIETLKQNTTYTLSLTGVSDVTENNALPTKTYIISTGDYLDSLSISGRVMRSEDDMADTSVMVYLYQAKEGIEVIRNKKPAYLAPVLFSGQFSIEAIPPGSYYLFALNDQNQNYLYDSEVERVAFDTTVQVLTDTSQLTDILLYSWSDIPATENTKGSRKNLRSDKSKFGYSMSIDTSKADPQQDVYAALKLDFTAALSEYDSTLISCTDTSSAEVVSMHVELDSTLKILSLEPTAGWQPAHTYKIFIKEGAMKDSAEAQISTHYFYLTTLSAEDYSTLLIHFIPTDSSLQYVCELTTADGTQEYILNSQNGFDIYSPHVLGPEADLQYFLDLNTNGVRDIGSLDELRQPEVQQKVLQKFVLKKNWDHVYTYEAIAPGQISSSKKLNKNTSADE